MKELSEIQNKGTPEGIALIAADDMLLWKFTLSVLGDETIYRVSFFYSPCPAERDSHSGKS